MRVTTRMDARAIGSAFWVGIVALVVWLAVPGVVRGQEGDAGPAGEYAVTIATEDVPQDLGGGAALLGRWRIAFNEDGSYEIGRQDVGVVVGGRYTVEGDRLTVTDASGLLACGLGGDAALVVGVYEWEVVGDRLSLVAVEDACAGRRLLLVTRTLLPYAACPDGESIGATPAAGDGASERDATPVATPSAESEGEATSEVEAAIDELLARMSSCWATGDPERFLALVSDAQRSRLVDDGDDDLRRFDRVMASPLVWERVGVVEVVSDQRVTATVRQLSGDEADLVGYAFVLVDGTWRWDGPAAD